MITLSILWLHLLFHLEPFSVNPITMGKLSDQIGKKGFKQFLHSQQHGQWRRMWRPLNQLVIVFSS